MGNLKARKIGVSALCRISASGGAGIYLYIPKHFADAYGIVGAAYAEVHFRQVFFDVAEAEKTDKEEKVVDLTSRKKASSKPAGDRAK